MKILFLRFSSIGDIILTTPALRAAKQQIPNVEIHIAVKAQYSKILEENPNVSKVHKLEKDLKPLISELKKEDFDMVIDLHHNLRTLQIKRALKKPSRSFNKLNKQKWLIVNFGIDRLPDIHIVDRYLETLEEFGVKKDDQGLEFYIADDDRINRDKMDPRLKDGYYALAIGAQHYTKILPVDKLVEICEKAEQPVILLGDKNDRERAREILENLTPSTRERVIDLCGKIPLGTSADYIRQANGVFCHDSGLMHIAAAFHVPIISYWGNTIPEFGMYPYHTWHKRVENLDLRCRPCTKIGYSKCPKGHFKCMRELEIDVDFSQESV